MIRAGDGEPTLRGLCSVSAELLSMGGATAVLMGSDEQPVAICSSDPAFEPLEEVQFTLGVGPAIDVFRHGRPAIEADMVGEAPLQWPGFAERAIGSGVRSLFSFPLRIGGARFGALTFYGTSTGALGPERYADARVLAGVVARSILDLQADAGDGALAAGLAGGHVDLDQVHQASGMVSAQLHVDVDEARSRLRAHAFASGTTVQRVARDITDRRLQLSL